MLLQKMSIKVVPSVKDMTIPLILPFDFVNGAGVIVVMPDDERI